MPNYLLLLRGGARPPVDATPQDVAEWIAPYQRWLDELQTAGHLVDAHRLAPESRWLGVDAPPTADAHDIIGGYYLIRADSLDGAEALAHACPHVQRGGTIEVRPLAAAGGDP